MRPDGRPNHILRQAQQSVRTLLRRLILDIVDIEFRTALRCFGPIYVDIAFRTASLGGCNDSSRCVNLPASNTYQPVFYVSRRVYEQRHIYKIQNLQKFQKIQNMNYAIYELYKIKFVFFSKIFDLADLEDLLI